MRSIAPEEIDEIVASVTNRLGRLRWEGNRPVADETTLVVMGCK